VNEIVTATLVENYLPPIGCDKQSRFAATVADDVRIAILRKVSCHGGICVQTLMNDVFPPRFLCLQTESAGHNTNSARDC
jgi:hypothetical protein